MFSSPPFLTRLKVRVILKRWRTGWSVSARGSSVRTGNSRFAGATRAPSISVPMNCCAVRWRTFRTRAESRPRARLCSWRTRKRKGEPGALTMDLAARRKFLDDYAKIRRAEGRGSHDPAYYRALPYQDLTGRNSAQWTIRGRSYRHFER